MTESPSARSDPSPDVVVVGGGIVGASAAAFLAGAGARVLLVERDGLASGASGANAGGIWHPVDPVLVALYRASLPLYRELAATSNVFRMPEHPVGLLELSASGTAVRDEVAAMAAAYPELAPTVLDPAGVRSIEPGAADGLWGCLLDLGYPVAPAAGTYALASRAEALGAVVRSGRAASLELVGDRVAGVRLDGGSGSPAGRSSPRRGRGRPSSSPRRASAPRSARCGAWSWRWSRPSPCGTSWRRSMTPRPPRREPSPPALGA